MPTPKFTKQDIDQLAAWFQRRYESQFAWKSSVSTNLVEAALRGAWPMSSVAYTNPQGLDVSGNGLHLTNNNVSTFGFTGLIPHVTFDGTNQWLSHADGGAANAFDITGTEAYVDAGDKGLTLGGWFYITETGTQEAFMSKWGAAGQRSYLLYIQAGDTIRAQFSDDGTASDNATSPAITVFNRWYFIVGRFVPAVTVDLFVNSDAVVSTPTARASVFDSTSAFGIGARVAAADPFDGKASHLFFCAAALSGVTIRSIFEQQKAMFGVK